MRKTILFLCLIWTNYSISKSNDPFKTSVISFNGFVENKGQWNKEIEFRYYGLKFVANFTSDGILFTSDIEDFDNQKANHSETNEFKWREKTVSWGMLFSQGQKIKPMGCEELPSRVFRFTPEKSNIGIYQKLIYREVEMGVDLIFYINSFNQLEYDWVVSPDAHYPQLGWTYKGVDSTWIDEHGNLFYSTGAGIIRETRPLVSSGDKMIDSEVNFELANSQSVIITYNNELLQQSFTIDPVIMDWGSYFYGKGNNSVYLNEVEIGEDGTIYLVGTTRDYFFSNQSSLDSIANGQDAVVARLSSDGDSLLSFCYIGGDGVEFGSRISLDPSAKNLLIAGTTSSDNLATTGVYKTSKGTQFSGFIASLNSDLSKLVFLTYVLDLDGSIWFSDLSLFGSNSILAGISVNQNVASKAPFTTNSFLKSYSGGSTDAYIFRMSLDGKSLLSSTLLGGNGQDQIYTVTEGHDHQILAIGSTSSTNFPLINNSPIFNKFLKGNSDGFIAIFDTLFKSPALSQLIGGNSDDAFYSTETDVYGNIYLGGSTSSSDFPISTQAFQKSLNGQANLTLMKLNPKGSAFVFSTFIGGNGSLYFNQYSKPTIKRNIKNEIWISGLTNSTTFPTTADAFLRSNSDSNILITISKLSERGDKLVYSSYFGASATNYLTGVSIVERNCRSEIVFCGQTHSTKFPVSSGVYRAFAPVDSNFQKGIYPVGFLLKLQDTLRVDDNVFDLDTLIKCNKFFLALDGKNEGAKHLWNAMPGSRYYTTDSAEKVWLQATYGCDTIQDSVVIVRFYSPVNTLPKDTTSCSSNPLNLTLGLDTIQYSYLWQPDDYSNSKAIQKTGTYYFEIGSKNCGILKDSIAVKFKQSPLLEFDSILIICNDSFFTFYLPEEGGIDFILVKNDTLYDEVTLKGNGSFHITAVNQCGISSDSFDLIFSQTPASLYQNDTIICNDNIVCFNKSQIPNSNYLWKQAHSADTLSFSHIYCTSRPGSYVLTSSNSCGEISDTFNIIERQSPQLDLDSVYEPCEGKNLILHSGLNSDLYEILWENSISADSIEIEKSGQYSIHVRNECGSDSAKFMVEFIEVPEADFEIESNCEGNELVILNNTRNGKNFEWLFGDGTILNDQNPMYKYKKIGLARTYLVLLKVTNSPYCKDSIIRPVDVYPVSSADFDFLFLNDTVLFSPYVQSTVFQYQWDFGDGMKSQLVNPKHIYQDSKPEHNACLVLINTDLCRDTVCKWINLLSVEPQTKRENRFKFYPNPASDFVQFEDEEFHKIKALNLYRMNGIFQTGLRLNSNGFVDIQGVNSGTYRLEIVLENQIINTMLVVLK